MRRVLLLAGASQDPSAERKVAEKSSGMVQLRPQGCAFAAGHGRSRASTGVTSVGEVHSGAQLNTCADRTFAGFDMATDQFIFGSRWLLRQLAML